MMQKEGNLLFIVFFLVRKYRVVFDLYFRKQIVKTKS